MAQGLREAIVAYLNAHRHCVLATVTPDGNAHVSTVSYVNEGLEIYFMTDPSSRKARNIESCPNIAIAVTEDYLDWDEIRGIHLSGTVEWIKDETELKKTQKMFADKFPQVHKYLGQYGVTIDIIPFLRIKPAKIDYLDYSKGFNHWDTLEI